VTVTAGGQASGPPTCHHGRHCTGDVYRYTGLKITELSPDHGRIAGGTPVTVTGDGFATGAGETEFKFGKSLAAVECPSMTECTMVAPAQKSLDRSSCW